MQLFVIDVRNIVILKIIANSDNESKNVSTNSNKLEKSFPFKLTCEVPGTGVSIPKNVIKSFGL